MNVTFESFVNEPCLDFSIPENREALKAALEQVKGQLGREYPLIIGGERIFTEQKIVSINPGNLDEIVGYVSKADTKIVDRAMQVAWETFETWKRVPPEERAQYLFKAADVLRRRRNEFSAWLIYEAGKNYTEADAEVAEAIDFMEYYGRSIIQISQDDHGLIRISDEDNHMTYIPLGVGAIIPPWNFPLAICTGLTVSAVVAGNTVLLKPASATPIIAYKFVEAMEEAGLPKGVINYIPGSGGEIGDYLSAHPKTRFISFTGSKDVGLRINEIAGRTAEGQIWIKRVNAEMGGKDGVIVDETADLEAAANAIIESAFSFQGQKCSAGSRAIIVESVYDEMVAKIVEKTKALTVGDPKENHPVGPVIDKNAYEKILGYIEIGKKEAKLACGGGKAEGNGYYIQPTVFVDADPKSRIMQEEIFGPVLAVCKAKDWKEAIDIFNNTEYGLTGSYFSNDEERIRYGIENIYCGNLYINRKCTGALVGVHPFGGFNMSGTDSKSGGQDYLKLFMQAKTYTRKLK